MFLNDPETDAQPQAGTFAYRLRGVKGIKTRCGSFIPGPVSLNSTTTLSRLRRVLIVKVPPFAASIASTALLMMLKNT